VVGCLDAGLRLSTPNGEFNLSLPLPESITLYYKHPHLRLADLQMNVLAGVVEQTFNQATAAS
jgi:hypothetical protein